MNSSAPIPFETIRLLVLDVDGVLTDGGISYTASGDEIKTFNVKDGSGMKYWKRAGGKLAIITGRQSPVVARRAGELHVDALRQGAKYKHPVLLEVLEELKVTPEQTAVVGDDLTDLPMMKIAGFSACPSDAVEEVRRRVHHVCQAPGGGGVAREVVERLLRTSGAWDTIMERYLPAEKDMDV